MRLKVKKQNLLYFKNIIFDLTMKIKKALIFGITGQDGAYLSKFLLNKKYIVHGVIRRSSSFNTSRLEDIYQEPSLKKNFYFTLW